MRFSVFSRKPLALALSVCFAHAAAQAVETTEPVEIEVSANRLEGDGPDEWGERVDGATRRQQGAATVDSVRLLGKIPGISYQTGGALSGIPVIRGLGDERIGIMVDGVNALAACPNHMNTPLSYIAPSAIQSLTVYKGIAPVSVARNQIGGAIVAESGQPRFAAAGQQLLTGSVGGFYSSNGDGRGANLNLTAATDSISINYTGSTAQANTTTAGGNFKPPSLTLNPNTMRGTVAIAPNTVASTAYEASNQSLSLALKSEHHTLQLQYGWQDVPFEGYANQRMDLTGNRQERYNLRYWGDYAWGTLEAQAYHELVNHRMNFGPDRQYWYGSMGVYNVAGMPMQTNSNTDGAKLKGTINLEDRAVLRTGVEYQHYFLNDTWPPVANSMMMGPRVFQNINGGVQQTASLYAEWEKPFATQWQALLGARYSFVNAATGAVHGYSNGNLAMMNSYMATDAQALNNAKRSNSFHDVDVSASLNYTADIHQDMTLGLARQVRAPSLYELYSWSTDAMNSSMNNFTGDGNGYFGNPNLKAETAYTASAKYDLHSSDGSQGNQRWQLKIEPYYSYVANYIDAVQWTGNAASGAPATNLQSNRFTILRYVNQNADLAGIDLSGQMPLAKTDFGRFGVNGLLSYVYGKNRNTGYGLYNVMPLNGKLDFTHQYGGWDNALEFVAVAAKRDRLSVERNEVATPGYVIVNLKASHSWGNSKEKDRVRLDAGINNVFNTLYYPPLGGAYLGQGATMGLNSVPWGIAVPGQGISFYTALNVKF